MTFYEIEFPLAALNSDEVEATLFDIGASSITFVDGGDEPVLEPGVGEIRLWSDTRVRALFQQAAEPQLLATSPLADTSPGAASPSLAASSRSAASPGAATPDHRSASSGAATATSSVALILSRLAEVLGPHITDTARVRGVETQDWERVWLKDWKSMRFGRRLWVCPTAAAPPDDPNAIVVRLDPGLAFGTGTHPTTALCLQILDSLPVSGRTVIDYGCGSGILGIAALKLGAAHAVGVDLDPQALLATRENAIRNGVSANIDVLDVELRSVEATRVDALSVMGTAGIADTPRIASAPDIAGVQAAAAGPAGAARDLRPAFCVMANILAGPLIELAPKLTAACEPGGYLLLSGLLKTQAYAVKAAYAAGFDMVQVIERDDWCCIYARRGV